MAALNPTIQAFQPAAQQKMAPIPKMHRVVGYEPKRQQNTDQSLVTGKRKKGPATSQYEHCLISATKERKQEVKRIIIKGVTT